MTADRREAHLPVAHMRERLITVLEFARRAQVPINAEIRDAPHDVPVLALIDNGEGWELCTNPREGFDLWHDDETVQCNLDLPAAVGALAAVYIEAKVRRVLARIAARG